MPVAPVESTIRTLAAGLVMAGLAAASASAAALGVALEKKARVATFEVVVPKPPEGALRYERPLPLELVPFAIRQDKYQPIGTAFVLDKNRFVTAAHVLAAAMAASYETVLIRTQGGAVHEIGEIHQLSLAEDYVIFSLLDDFTAKPLPVNTKPVIGGTAHAIGNALGEGIVIRDGLLTSETPEEREGAWNWLRFSAAASPGNSGGPLLDDKGRVIGVVVAISPNENLNYALPIARVLNPKFDSAARLRTRQSFGVAIAPVTIVATLDKTIPLPMSYQEFASAFVKATNDFYDESMAELIRQHEARLFPKGETSRRLLSKANWAATLQIIAQQTNGEWDQVPANRVADVVLPPDGELGIAQSSGMSVLKLRKPSAVPLADLFTDSEVFMDLLLKGMPLTRPIADQMVRITSLGPAASEEWHVDRYGRKWQLRTWSFGFVDMIASVLALPKPDGADLMLQIAPSGMRHAVSAQMRFLSDYAYTGYYAALRDWRTFMTLPDLHPEIFKSLRLDLDMGRRVRFSSPRFRLNLDNWLQDIREDSRMSMQLAYYVDDGAVKWDIANFLVSEDPEEETYVKVTRWSRPAPTTPADETRDWADIVARKGDFSGRPRYEQPITKISRVLDSKVPDSRSARADPDFLYLVTFQVRQFVPSDDLKDMLERAMQAVELLE
ncbi:MAG: trypsin-like peptidase domain-containing protein [Gammaproteobacteria bacterium]